MQRQLIEDVGRTFANACHGSIYGYGPITMHFADERPSDEEFSYIQWLVQLYFTVMQDLTYRWTHDPYLWNTAFTLLMLLYHFQRVAREKRRNRLRYKYDVPARSKEMALYHTVMADSRRTLLPFNMPINIFNANPMHSHPRAAACRSAANEWMINVIRTAGFEPYHVSKSRTDDIGSRHFYFAKDLMMQYQNDRLTKDHVITMTDVDYYVDMPSYLKHGNNILMYTFVPQTSSGTAEDIAWRSVGNKVEYTVSGGSTYSHELWDYTGDIVTAINDDGDLLVYNVEQRVVPGDEQHRIVLFSLGAKVTNGLNLFWRWIDSNIMHIPPVYYGMEGVNIKRKSLSNFCFDAIKGTVSITQPGTFSDVEIPSRLYDSIVQRFKNKTAPPVVADIERMLSAASIPDPQIAAPIIFNQIGPDLSPNIVSTKTLCTTFKPVGPLVCEDPDEVGQAITSPLVSEPAMFAAKGYNADLACITGRVNKPRNDKVPPREYNRYATEFVTKCVPKPNVGTPLMAEEVRELQSKPMQRSRYDQFVNTFSSYLKNNLSCFIKTEPYANANAPRNITTNSVHVTVLLSAYTLVFKTTNLKKLHWYAPGLKPAEIVERLATVTARGAMASDYSRFDGSISRWMQERIVCATYMRWCEDKHRPHLKQLLDSVFTRKATTTSGLRFDPGYGTRSGSPTTTDGNTMMNAFVQYATFRRMGMSCTEAWDSLGIYCGDDGLTKIVPDLQNQLNITCTDLGLQVEIVTHPPEGPFQFCGRYFIHPATTVNSFQDPIRTLAKLHLSGNRQVSREQAAYNKATGYLVTDQHTPLIGDWAQRVVDLTGIKTTLGLTAEEQFKLENQSWPYADDGTLESAFCSVIGLDTVELGNLRELVRSAVSLDSFPVVLNTYPKHKIPAVIGGVVVGPMKLNDEHASDTGETNRRRNRSRGAGSGGPDTQRTKRRREPPRKEGRRKANPSPGDKSAPKGPDAERPVQGRDGQRATESRRHPSRNRQLGASNAGSGMSSDRSNDAEGGIIRPQDAQRRRRARRDPTASRGRRPRPAAERHPARSPSSAT
nr:MAG: RNA-dependent RNA polymerase [Bat faecal associated nodavirus 3]